MCIQILQDPANAKLAVILSRQSKCRIDQVVTRLEGDLPNPDIFFQLGVK